MPHAAPSGQGVSLLQTSAHARHVASLVSQSSPGSTTPLPQMPPGMGSKVVHADTTQSRRIAFICPSC